MAFGPSWLSSSKEETPAPPPPTEREIQEMKDLPAVIQFMRLLNLGAAGTLIAASVCSFMPQQLESHFSLTIFFFLLHVRSYAGRHFLPQRQRFLPFTLFVALVSFVVLRQISNF
jgi:hypothetical protein